jgi:hypothetical protein
MRCRGSRIGYITGDVCGCAEGLVRGGGGLRSVVSWCCSWWGMGVAGGESWSLPSSPCGGADELLAGADLSTGRGEGGCWRVGVVGGESEAGVVEGSAGVGRRAEGSLVGRGGLLLVVWFELWCCGMGGGGVRW